MRLIILAAAMLASLAGAKAQTAGDWVLARWKNGPHWYPGVVQSVSGDQLIIAYDDGEREALFLNSVRPYSWRIGSRVECNYRGSGWYAGRIIALQGAALAIAYDDGDRENTRTGRCRSN